MIVTQDGKSICNCLQLQILHQKGISLTFPRDPIDDLYVIHSLIKERLSFPFLPTATAKKLRPTFCHSRLSRFTFFH